MSIHSAVVSTVGPCVLGLVISLTITGCQWWPAGSGIALLPTADRVEPFLHPARRGRIGPRDDRRLVEALRSPSANVRLKAIRHWTTQHRGDLPVEAVDLRTDPDTGVGAAAMAALAMQRHPDAHEYLTAGLHDQDLRVRLAAIDAFGQLGGTDSRQTLVGLLDGQGELIRAQAVRALAELGDRQAVADAARDESWRVRLAVAQALSRYPDAIGTDLAHQLLDDASADVQLRVISSLETWPLEQAGPLLLEAMAESGYKLRSTAAGQLASRWPPAAEFPVDGPQQRRAEMLERLRRGFAEHDQATPNSADQ